MEEGDLHLSNRHLSLSTVNRAMCWVGDTTFIMMQGLPYSQGAHGLVEGQSGGGLKSLIKAVEEGHPERWCTWEGHFLQTEEIRKGFLDYLNPKLSLEELGANWGKAVQRTARKHHTQKHKGIRKAGSLPWRQERVGQTGWKDLSRKGRRALEGFYRSDIVLCAFWKEKGLCEERLEEVSLQQGALFADEIT